MFEKYGYEFFRMDKDIGGVDSRVYRKALAIDGPDKDRRNEKGTCPNKACCQEKGIEGCYECEELDKCSRGFYQPDNDGANACKAQAMYIRKYGKEKL